MVKLIITRHGESQANRDNVYTGWSDVLLTKKGIEQARLAAQLIKNLQIPFYDVHTSYLQRAIITANIICDEIDESFIPIHKTWRLNERHYGALRGMNKELSKQQFGVEQIAKWRRSYTELPPQLAARDHERRYDRLGVKIPLSESLEMTQKRLLPYWNDVIAGKLIDGQNQLVVAHGSSLRALIKYLDKIPDDEIDKVEVPNGQPIMYEFDKQLNVVSKIVLN